ncbi:MAG: PLP-dependent aminotransferase family protein [Gemmataceae bacterium]
MISLAAGLVDEQSLPTEEVAAAEKEILSSSKTGKMALQYGSTHGFAPLRKKCLEFLTSADGTVASDVHLTPDHVMITTGSQQTLYLLGEALLDPGDIVFCEAPSYFVFQSLLESAGARVVSVPMDENGMQVDWLEAKLQQFEKNGELARVKMIYSVDYFQNPTGLSLSTERRAKLVEIAKAYSKHHRIVIVEDAAYRELRYDGPDRPSIKKFDPTNEYVVFTSTFSKPLSPGLKTGYAILPADLVGPLVNLKSSHDFGSSTLNQVVIDRLIETGVYRKHIEKLRAMYRSKRDAMLSAMKKEFADWPAVTWTHADGGMYSWIMFPKHIDTGPDGPLIDRGVKEGVLYIPGQYCHVPDENGKIPKHEARLSFGVANEDQLREGIRRLRQACRGLE